MNPSQAKSSLVLILIAVIALASCLSQPAAATVGPRQSSATLSTTHTSFTGTLTLTTTSAITRYSYTGTVTTGVTSIVTAISTVSNILTFTQTSTSTSTVATVPANPNCPVAAIAAASFLEPYANSLREFRGNQILQTRAGWAFMLVFNGWYYAWAPLVAHVAQNNHIFSDVLQVIFVPLFAILFLSSFAYFAAAPLSPESGAIIAGSVAASLVGLVYVAPVAYVFLRGLRKRRLALARVHVITLTLWVAGNCLLIGAAYVLDSLALMGLTTASLTLSMLAFGSVVGVRAIAFLQPSMMNPTHDRAAYRAGHTGY